MADLIDRQAVVNVICEMHVGGQDAVKNALPNTYGADLREIIEEIDALPPADAVDVVRCKDCKHRWVNEHYGEKGYMKIKAMCLLDTDDPFELGRNAYDDDWFCADGERKDE